MGLYKDVISKCFERGMEGWISGSTVYWLASDENKKIVEELKSVLEERRLRKQSLVNVHQDFWERHGLSKKKFVWDQNRRELSVCLDGCWLQIRDKRLVRKFKCQCLEEWTTFWAIVVPSAYEKIRSDSAKHQARKDRNTKDCNATFHTVHKRWKRLQDSLECWKQRMRYSEREMFGWELECLIPRTTNRASFLSLVSIGDDASLQCLDTEYRTAEVRTATFDIQTMPVIMQELNKLDCYVNASCGGHIHANLRRDSLFKSFLFRDWIQKHKEDMRLIGGRPLNYYCDATPNVWSQTSSAEFKYQAIRVDDTTSSIEYRFFCGSEILWVWEARTKALAEYLYKDRKMASFISDLKDIERERAALLPSVRWDACGIKPKTKKGGFIYG
jgi:hypothetical protein